MIVAHSLRERIATRRPAVACLTYNRDMKHKLVRILAVLLPGFVSLGCSGASPPPAIFLGHIATLSGPEARAGKSAEQGIRLALDDLGPSASEPFQGKPLVVRHVDAMGKLDDMEAQAARLVSINKAVGLLGGLTRDEALRLDRSRAPVLTPIGMRTTAMSDLVFTTGLSPRMQGDALAQFLVDEAPAAGSLIVDPRRDESLAFAQRFRHSWEDSWQKKHAKGTPPRWIELALPKDTKPVEWAESVSKDQRRTIVFAGAAADFETLRRAWGASAPVLVFAGDDGSWIPDQPLAGQTVYVATAFALVGEASKAHEFAKKYREANRQDPDVDAAIAYDNVRLFVEALKKGQSASPEKIRDELLKIQDFTGLTGPLSFTKDQHLRRPAFITRIDGSTHVPAAIKSYPPAP